MSVMMESLRPAQAQILGYTGGELAISAVPGAGKTFILTQLIARLVGDPTLGVRPSQILVLTYMRSAALTFKRRSAEVLAKQGLTAYGLQTMTIHAFCLAVVRQARAIGADEDDTDLEVLSETEQIRELQAALDQFLLDPAAQADWQRRYGSSETDGGRDPRALTCDAARKVISAARNFGLSGEQVYAALGSSQPELAFLYHAYETRLAARGALDFDGLVQQAITLLRDNPALLAWYHRRFHYVLEDEAQDSTPAQDVLIRLLTDRKLGARGNLVRVGDANQAIMTSFTFNDPKYFREFCERQANDRTGNGRHVAMNESSRSARPILAVANALADCCREHPDAVVRQAFDTHRIQPATAGKKNPEPGDLPSWTVYGTKQEEQLGVLTRVRAYLREHPDHRAAVLVFSNKQLVELRDRARMLGLPLYESSRTPGGSKSLLTVIERALRFLSLPEDGLAYAFFQVLDARAKAAGESWVGTASVKKYLAREASLEDLIFPASGLPPARPEGLAEADYAALVFGAQAMRALLEARHLPPSELLPAIAAELLDDPQAPLIAARAAALATRAMALPRLGGVPAEPLERLRYEVEELGKASNERREILATPTEIVPPGPGQLELLTLHRAKGAEYDAVWLPGLGRYYGDKSFFPWDLAHAEIWDQQAFLAEQALLAQRSGHTGDGTDPAYGAKRQLVAERMRLLYVGVTRAERELHLSCYARDLKDPPLAHIQALAGQCERRLP